MKVRLDKLLIDRGLAESRSKALALVMSGSVSVDGKVVTKAGSDVRDDADIALKEVMPYVGRGALKLQAALDAFAVDPAGKVAVDVGASTGGFTDLMLRRGALRVYALDVGHGQLHYRLRHDPRVICLEGVNVRYLDPRLIPEACDIATCDVSFISLKLIIPPLLQVMRPAAELIALVKPQFEAGRNAVKKGIVRDAIAIEEVLKGMEVFMCSLDLEVTGALPSPIKGAKGNQEFLMHARVRSRA